MPDEKTGEAGIPQEVDWEKEIGYEIDRQTYEYILPKDPEIVGRMVTAAVYKLLSGHEVTDRETERFIEDSPTSIPNEETEILARGLFEQARYNLMEKNNYEDEWAEAREQGEAAREWLKRDRDFGFHTYYDYYKGLIPIKAGVYVDKNKNDPEMVILRAPMAEVAATMGFPSLLIYREISQSSLKNEATMFRFWEKIAQKLGFDTKSLTQGMFNDELHMCFVRTLNDCGHTDFDEVRTAIVDSGREGYPSYTPQELYDMLNENERQAVGVPRAERLNAEIVVNLTEGKTAATFKISFWSMGEVWFNPQTMSMEGRITPSEHDFIGVSLYPKISKETMHVELLGLRKKAQELCDKLGIPEKSSPW